MKAKQYKERNELVKLIEEIGYDWISYKHECRENEKEPVFTYDGFCADSLLDKGYRKQKWTSVEEALPEEDGEYLTRHDGYYMLLNYSTTHKLFNVTDKPETAIKTVTHWMPLPEAP